jgi:CBS domain-containing protein
MPKQSHMSDLIRRKPVTLPPAATVQQACQAMHEHHVGAVLVVDDEQHLLGIFTGRDLVRLLAEGRNPAHAHLSAVMTKDPRCLAPGQKAEDALAVMHDGGFRHVPVVENGLVVGVVSRGDLARLEGARMNQENGFWERL